jgi:hypothetical protein
MVTLRRTSWKECRGLQIGLNKWAVELWYLPPLTFVNPHSHGFDGKFFKLFGRGVINKKQVTKFWGLLDFRVYNIRHGERHWLQNGKLPLIFVNIQKHSGSVVSAGVNFVQ